MSVKTKTQVPAPSAEEKALQAQNLELAKLQTEALRRQAGFQEQAEPLFANILEDIRLEQEIATPEERAAVARGEFERQQRLGPIQEELLDLQLEQIRRGGAASPEQIRLIGEATEAGIATGESDIARFQQQGLQQIREELAPSLGLRPTDAPIQQRGLRLAEEAQRQQGQLVRGLRGAQAQAQLNFPLAAQQLTGAQAGFQQQLGEAAGQFQEQLRQQAFQNRLRLTGGAPSLGISGPGIQQVFAGERIAGATQQTFDPVGQAAKLAQGIGSAASGFSSKDLKDNNQEINDEEILNELETLDVEKWTYKWENREHIGPYAEDFKDKFKVGDGTTIHMIDAVGVLMSAVKALTKQVKELQHA